jgi:hypothetical protein
LLTALQAGTPPAEIVPLLAKQLCSPVLWEPSVRLMKKAPMLEGRRKCRKVPGKIPSIIHFYLIIIQYIIGINMY